MFKHPFNLIVSGASGTGKTQWVIKLLKHSDVLIEPPPKRILYCFGEANETIIKLESGGIETFHGMPDEEMVKGKYYAIVLDDLMLSVGNNDFFDRAFTLGSHHWNVSIIFLTQNLFAKDTKIAKQNSHYITLLKNPTALLQIKTLGSQLFPKRLSYFMESYYDATNSSPYSYLLINNHPTTNDDLRLSTNIFPGETTTIYLPI